MEKLTQESFIQNSKEKHNDKYDYSLVEYRNTRCKVKIICPKHGEFELYPSNHLKGRGCQKCAQEENTKLRAKRFIEKMEKINENQYTFEKMDFKNAKTSIEVTCPTHGSFWILPVSLLDGGSCPYCIKRTLSREEIIQRFIAKHGSTYNYRLVKYTSSKKKVKIICPVHGVFKQLPYDHIKGHGCVKCAAKKNRENKTEKFIEKMKNFHENKYTYEKMDFKDSKTPIEVTCPTHGSFWVLPITHVSGGACPQCVKRSLSKEEVIQKFRDKHGLTYDYSLVEYIKVFFPVKIICRKHGVFEQAPDTHWSGSGCPTCANEKAIERLKQYRDANMIPVETLIEEFKKVHGDAYCYDHITKENYKGLEYKIKIQCKKHGFFYRLAKTHRAGTAGSGCPECKTYSRTQDEVLAEFKRVHGDTYDYSEFIYRGQQNKVKIICKTHGVFLQTPHAHIKGTGCALCKKTATQDQVIAAFKAKHGDTYGYERVKYRKGDLRVEIYCKNHQEYFWQTPQQHKAGRGCPKCATDKTRLSLDVVLERFKAKHGDRYDYSEVEFTGMRNKVKIKCKEHGYFYQVCAEHADGHGCKECSIEVIREKAIKRSEEAKKAQEISEK